MSTSSPTSRLDAILVCCFAATAALACAALAGAAAIVPAPPVAAPFIAAVCIGCPLATGEELRSSIGALRDPRFGPLRRRHLIRLRRDLDRLPETDHPLEL